MLEPVGGGIEGSLCVVLWRGGDMSYSENVELRCPILGSNGHKKAIFGGLSVVILPKLLSACSDSTPEHALRSNTVDGVSMSYCMQ